MFSGRWRDRAQKDRRSSSRLVRVTCGDPWSKRDKSPMKSACGYPLSCQNPARKPASFEEPVSRPDVSTVLLFAVFPCYWLYSHVGQAAGRGQRRKSVICDTSGVVHRAVTILSAPIWFTRRRHCTVFRHLMQLWLLFLR